MVHHKDAMDRWLLLKAGAVGTLIHFFRKDCFGNNKSRAALAILSLAAESPEVSHNDLIEGGFDSSPIFWALHHLRDMLEKVPVDGQENNSEDAILQVWFRSK